MKHPPEKRDPLLADLFGATELKGDMRRVLAPSFFHDTQDTLSMAKRFVLDNDATRYCGSILRRYPRLVVDAGDFAIPAFQRMWIELDFPTFWEALTGKPDLDPTGDARLAFCINGPTVRLVTCGKPSSSGAHLMPLQFILHRPMTWEQKRALAAQCRLSPLGVDAILWGGASQQLIEGHDNEGLKALAANHTLELRYRSDLPGLDQLAWNGVLERCAGDLKNILGILLFINRTRDVQVMKEVGWERGHMIQRKPRSLFAHSVISLSLDPTPRFSKMVAGEGIMRRLHDVRGHFCHNERARTSQCGHSDWDEVAPLRWVCQRCKGLRWWRREHTRGHHEVGWGSAEYAVTA